MTDYWDGCMVGVNKTKRRFEMKVKKRTLLMMLIGSGILVGISAGIIYTYFSTSKQPVILELLVLGIVIFAIGVVLTVISFLSDSY